MLRPNLSQDHLLLSLSTSWHGVSNTVVTGAGGGAGATGALTGAGAGGGGVFFFLMTTLGAGGGGGVGSLGRGQSRTSTLFSSALRFAGLGLADLSS